MENWFNLRNASKTLLSLRYQLPLTSETRKESRTTNMTRSVQINKISNMTPPPPCMK